MFPKLQFLGERLGRLRAQLPYIPRALALVWQAARGWTIAWGFLLLVQGLLPVASVHLTKLLVDSLVLVVQGGREFQATFLYAALLAGVMLLTELLRAASDWVRTAQSELVLDHIQSLIHRQASAVDLAFYDWPEFYDHLHRARQDATYRPLALVESIGGIAQNSITLTAMAAVLLRFGWWLPPALLLATLPALLVVVRHTVRQHEWRRRRTPDERKAWYYDWLLTGRDTAAEVRLFSLAGHFQSLYQAVRARLRGERLRLVREQGLARLGAGVLGLGVIGAVSLWMLWQAMQGRYPLGDLALFQQASQQGLRLMRSLLDTAGQFYANVLFLGNLFEYLELKPGVTEPPVPGPRPDESDIEVRFCDVAFRYPGSERLVFDQLNLTLPAGRTTAIVGPNGTGKSTLIRLLCRFYDPAAGSVEVNGTDLRIAELRELVTVLFQAPVHYTATARENIALDRSPGADARAVQAAAEWAGADGIIRRLPAGYDNMLGKWFADGAELSVGEWQRVALARAYCRPAPVIVLDEPTSAMDPWAEVEWMKRYREFAAGRTAVIMTHRLTTAKLADVIHVLGVGRVVESGSHGELLALGGTYAEAWEAQGKGGSV